MCPGTRTSRAVGEPFSRFYEPCTDRMPTVCETPAGAPAFRRRFGLQENSNRGKNAVDEPLVFRLCAHRLPFLFPPGNDALDKRGTVDCRRGLSGPKVG